MKRVRGLSPLTKEQKKRLKELSELSDTEIDTGEIREWDEEDFKRVSNPDE